MNGRFSDENGRTVDLVIPVYGSLPLVRSCLESILRFRTPAISRIIVVDDASPDRETPAYLDSLASRGEIEVIRHQENLGVVGAANTGVAASQQDVVLLNSDVEVNGDWVERLIRCADLSPAIGTVTPFSNNASICSYPFLCWWSGLPEGLTLQDLDGLFAAVNAGETADLPTGVSFCIYIRRACLEQIGLFDLERFGRGYGDETEFCQRAARAGWRNVICADTFVFHQAGGSFGPERLERAEAADRIIEAMYPGYQKRVRDFVLADPLRGFRERVDEARAALSTEQAIAVLRERAREKTWLINWLADVMR
jgi:O-antigen biosynthesis protein